MSGPAQAGLFIYASQLERLAHFYQSVLGMTRLHATDELVVLESPALQLVVHAMPAAAAASGVITSPPQRRDRTALKFFFTVPSLETARTLALDLGGSFDAQQWQGPGFRVCNAVDPEGNVFHVRQASAA